MKSKGLVLIPLLIMIGAVVAFGVMAYVVIQDNQKSDTNQTTNTTGTGRNVISSFADCVAAGYPVMESYPRRCNANGQSFTENTNVNGGSAVTAPFPLPIQINVASGWSVQYYEHEINTIKGGGPLQEMFLAPNDPTRGEFNSVYLHFDWYHFNPNAPLEDIAPLLNEGGPTPTTSATTLAGKPALFHTEFFDPSAETETETWYSKNWYLLRLDNDRILQVVAFYPTEADQTQYKSAVDAMIASLEVLPPTTENANTNSTNANAAIGW